MPDRIFSVGHSSRTIDELVELLSRHGIRALADIRRFPASRRHPQFERDALELALKEHDIDYMHLGAALGGYRQMDYSRYVETAAFREGLRELEALARGRPTAFLCAEKLPWHCHRRFVGRELSRRGWQVVHILDLETVWEADQPFFAASP